MNLCDEVRKGPPRWLIRAVVALAVLTVGVQIGLYKGRLSATTDAVRETIAAKDRQIELVKSDLLDMRRLLKKEQDKLRIILCESGVKHEGLWGDGGKSYGICQFQYATFDWMRSQAGRPELRWKRRADQLWLLDWALDQGYGKYWTCYGKGGGS